MKFPSVYGRMPAEVRKCNYSLSVAADVEAKVAEFFWLNVQSPHVLTGSLHLRFASRLFVENVLNTTVVTVPMS